MSNSDYRLDSSKSTRFTKMVDHTRYLTATDTAASKFSDGYGYTTAWQSLVTDSTAGRQHWYLRR